MVLDKDHQAITIYIQTEQWSVSVYTHWDVRVMSDTVKDDV